MVSLRHGKIGGPLQVTVIVFILLISATCCYSADLDLVFARSPQGSSAEQGQLEVATTFYGLNLKVVVVNSADDDTAFRELVTREETVGIAIAANALTVINQTALLRALHGRTSNVPVLILGVTPDVDPSVLRSWSGGATSGSRGLGSPLHSQYVFGRIDGLTSQISDLEVPLRAGDLSYLVLEEHAAAQRITSVRDGDELFPVFIKNRVQQQNLFVAAAVPSDESSSAGEDVVNAFLQTAPAMMFVKYCVGERGWHALHHYANLTVDDPWLRQPYGYVDYEGLLEEMERHKFHTTIAFIPWNYDRSEPAVVSLFRNHPDRFSIAIHGDNHDHKEFTDYKSRPLPVQIANIEQSLARMEKFRALTGIDYDLVMVFPHSIPPEKTLAALKTYNYLATINSTNVPQGDIKPSSPLFGLRPVTLSFAGFPSVSRYSMATPITRALLAINDYLDNPLFFYGHSDDLAKGVDAFDAVADEANKLQPDTEWRSLREIVRHLYLLKLRKDSNYDVLGFANNICLDNVGRANSTFYVRKQETDAQTINSVQVDGQPYLYQVENGYLNARVPVPAGGTRCIVIQYQNDLQLASISPSDHSFIVYLLRMASDFRDIYLSKSTTGLAFVRFYYDHGLSPARLIGSVFIFMTICMYAGYRLREFVRTKRQS
jgi:hypothetical protein